MENRTPNEILPSFYKKYRLPPDGGQSSPFVTIELTDRFQVYIPNFAARRKAVLMHDVHHLLTAYPSELKGEAEISAWEIASGCTNYWAALVLDSQGLLMGALLYPGATFRAFKRGRRSRNLYQSNLTEDTFLNMSISDLKKHLGLNLEPGLLKTTASDVFYYLYWLLVCAGIGLLSLIFLPLLLLYNVKLFLSR